MRWAGWLTQTRWTLVWHMARHARLARLLLWRRSKTRSSWPATCHDSLEEIRGSMANGWRIRLRRSGVWALRWSTALFELMAQALELSFIPIEVS